MPLLALDTSTDTPVVALAADGGIAYAGDVIAWRAAEGMRAQAVLSLVEEVLADAGTGRDGVRAIAVGTGPGGFTGLRVGVATARGMAHALGVPLGAVPTLAAVAWPAIAEELAAGREGLAWGSVDAKRGEVFARRWRAVSGIAGLSLVPDGDLHVVPTAELPALVGEAPHRHGAPTADGLVAAAALAPYGDPALVMPDYGREPDASPAAGMAATGGTT